MGLDAASIGAVGDRARRPGAAGDLRPRRSRAPTGSASRASAAELQALIEAVVVPETWFFRDREAFATLGRDRARERMAADSRRDGVLRLLSLPSSTGEEPYSMAMALLDAGVPANRFRVDAVDISARALALRRRGRVREELLSRPRIWRSAIGHFEATPHGYRLSDSVRRQVHFQQGNLLAADFLPGVGALRRDLLPQPADLLRPRHAGSRDRGAGRVC